jgi:hypothetical protein
MISDQEVKQLVLEVKLKVVDDIMDFIDENNAYDDEGFARAMKRFRKMLVEGKEYEKKPEPESE